MMRFGNDMLRIANYNYAPSRYLRRLVYWNVQCNSS